VLLSLARGRAGGASVVIILGASANAAARLGCCVVDAAPDSLAAGDPAQVEEPFWFNPKTYCSIGYILIIPSNNRSDREEKSPFDLLRTDPQKHHTAGACLSRGGGADAKAAVKARSLRPRVFHLVQCEGRHRSAARSCSTITGALRTSKQILDAKNEVEALLCLLLDSRHGVDAIVEKAVAAGGKADPGPKQDHGFIAASKILMAISLSRCGWTSRRRWPLWAASRPKRPDAAPENGASPCPTSLH
jgi:hypothetical protein